MNTKKWVNRFSHSAALLMMLSPMAVSRFVHAEETDTTPKTEVSTNDMKGKELSITIHKYGSLKGTHTGEYDETLKKDYGTVQTSPDETEYKKLANVQFKVTKVTAKSGQKASTIDPNDETTFDKTAETQTVTTGTDGTIKVVLGKYENAKGIYLIEELPSPAVEEVSQKMLLQLPLAVGPKENKTYQTNIDVYPKNKIKEDTTPEKIKENTTKTIDGQKSTFEIGKQLVWDISYKQVPEDLYKANEDGTEVYAKEFSLTDNLNPNLTVKPEDISGVYGPDQNVLDKDDYTVDIASATEEKEINGKSTTIKPVKITLTEKGMKKVHGQTIVFTLKATVNKLDIENLASKDIENTVTVKYIPSITPDGPGEKGTTDPKDPKDPKDPEKPGENTAQFQQIDIKKVDEADPDKVLEGAEFEVFIKNPENPDGGYDPVITTDKDMQHSVTEAGKPLTIRTGKDGIGRVYGLSPKETYYVKESKAPEGYDILDKFIEVKPQYGEKAAEIDATIGDNVDPIQNFIPMTGSQRRLALMVIGAGVAVTSMAYVYVQKKKREEESKA